MGIADLFKSIVGGKQQQEEEIVGVILEGPTPVESGDSSPRTLVFRLDSRPDLVFHQVERALAPTRKRGDRVKVHCHMDGKGTAIVEWIEKI